MPDHTDLLFDHPIYQLRQKEKSDVLLEALNDLTEHHDANCSEYHKLLHAHGSPLRAERLEDVPFVPVSLFKRHLLASVPEEDRFKLLTSSGTTGQQPSRIALDVRTAGFQKRAMITIMQSYLGRSRIPMIVIDHPSVVKRRDQFSARGAGILGMMNFGRAPIYALKDESMEIDLEGLQAFLEKHGDGPIFIFGFTFMVWKYFVQAIEDSGLDIQIPQGILVHSGGWKKLQDEAVSNDIFKARLKELCGIQNVHNFYGMVEQVGSIFVECEQGHLHAPVFSDVIVRRAEDWSVADIGEPGIIQVLSALPWSYPGHSLLTEDRGCITHVDSCPCGRGGKTIEVLGRLPRSEARGCSDTFETTGAPS